ncbi:hypothetical protein Ahu01nite_037380 [Winogradskya humida]|uniref:Uncharacterized protein n=1 Tax=Winogradskya humida TaxID=113566 RepID=A0ABQ3ZPY7_9ACTN|nr:hypothetical protein Ahu01nite_037380 [Actinoplanes humidus]
MTKPTDLRLKVVAKLCSAGACPTVYDSGRGTLVVQGYDLPVLPAHLEVPDGESLVEIPLELLAEVFRNMPGAIREG